MDVERRFVIYLELEPYLRQWLVHQNGGNIPVSLPRWSTERKILEVYLITLPPNAEPDIATDTALPVIIPDFKHKPPERYNYLPVRAKAELKNCIRNRFIIDLWNDLHHFGHIGKRRDELIYAWMDSHGIESTETNWNTIAKIYLRQRRNYLERERKKRTAQHG